MERDNQHFYPPLLPLISIHALRMERDIIIITGKAITRGISIHALRMERDLHIIHHPYQI